MNMQLQQAAQQQARIAKYDDCVRDADRALIYDFLAQPGWGFGWKSDPMTDRYSFFHKHFAGMISPDHYESSNIGSQPDCSEELGRNAPLLLGFWRALNSTGWCAVTPMARPMAARARCTPIPSPRTAIR